MSITLAPPAHPVPPVGVTPRDYQIECVDAIWEHWEGGGTAAAAVLPTGAGKTIIFAFLVERYLTRHPDRRVLIVSHTDELVFQAVSKIRAVAPHRTVGIVKGKKHNNVSAQIISASRQTLKVPARREQIHGVGLVVIDECHHSVAKTYQDILRHYGCLVSEGASTDPDRCLLAGFTATFARTSPRERGLLSRTWEEVVYRKDILWMMRRGYLLDAVARRVVVPDFDLSRVAKSHGEYQDGSLGEELDRSFAPELVARVYREEAGDRKGIGFAPTVASAYSFSDAFNEAGIVSEVVHGNISEDDRRAIRKRLRTGETKVVWGCLVYTEGFDEPTVDVVVNARPTTSPVIFPQMMGRALRPDLSLPPEKRGKALFLIVASKIPASGLATFVDMSSRRDVDDDDVDGMSLLEIEDMPEPDPVVSQSDDTTDDDTYDGPVRVVDFDVLAGESARVWGTTPDGARWTALGTRQYVFVTPSLTGDVDTYDVVWCSKTAGPGQAAGRHGTPGTPLADAMDAAEGYVMANATVREASLSRKSARWRRRPATEAQLSRALSLGISVSRDATSGAVSDLLESRQAAMRIDPLVHAARGITAGTGGSS